MIEIRNLTKIYRSGFFLRPKVGVKNLSLTVESNEIFGFLGQNGAGKTTTIKVLVGLSHPTEGEVLLLGRDARQTAVRKLLGYVPESPYFYEYLSAEEAMHFYGSLYELTPKVRHERTKKLLDLVELTPHARRPIKQFSKGMRQRLGLAQALLSDPKVVIMDEPTSGLDPMGRRLVKEIILRLKDEGKTVFFSSHILPDVEAICDRVGLLHRGQLLREGTIEDLVGTEPKRVEIVCRNISPAEFAPLVDKVFSEGGLVYLWLSEVSRKEELLEQVRQKGGTVEYIIPHRHSLEEYFEKLQLGEDEKGSS